MAPYEFSLDEGDLNWGNNLPNDPHTFFLNPTVAMDLQIPDIRPIELQGVIPSEANRVRAQAIADIAGREVLIPWLGDPNESERFTPGVEHTALSGSIVFSKDNGLELIGPDGRAHPIRPEDHLGRLLGVGAWKVAFRLGQDKALVIYYLDPQDRPHNPHPDTPREMLESKRRLEELGAPFVWPIDGLIEVYGRPALIMDLGSHQTFAMTTPIEMPGDDSLRSWGLLYDVSYLTDASVASLKEIKEWMLSEQVDLGDPQYMIDSGGYFYLHDYNEIILDGAPSNLTLRGIDFYLTLAERVLAARRASRG